MTNNNRITNIPLPNLNENRAESDSDDSELDEQKPSTAAEEQIDPVS